MDWVFPTKSQIYLGMLLLRLMTAYSLLLPAYLTARSFTVDLGLVFSIVQGTGLLLFSVGSLFLIFGFATRIISLVLFIFLLAIHFGLQAVALNVPQIMLFLALALLGPGVYSLDRKWFGSRYPDASD